MALRCGASHVAALQKKKVTVEWRKGGVSVRLLEKSMHYQVYGGVPAKFFV